VLRRRPGLPPRDWAADESAHAEAFRILRSNLLVGIEGLEHPVVLVTSAQAGEGKTSTTANLAVSLALLGKNVGLVDFDLRRPTLHLWFGADQVPGATDVLLGRRRLDDCLNSLSVGGAAGVGSVQLLTAGMAGEQPSEMLSTSRPARLLRELSEAILPSPSLRSSAPVDVVLVDSPPVLPVADTLILSRLVTGAVLVIDSGRTSAHSAMQAKDTLIRCQTRLLGVVLNQRTARSSKVDEYAYGYSYAGAVPAR
jgi:capsular exopolysaccharide synthesis family protein